jgi:hypothetical protein
MAQWYTFTLESEARVDEPNNYGFPQSTKPGCPGTGSLCAILANDNGFGLPVITSQLLIDIGNALNAGSDNSTVALRM